MSENERSTVKTPGLTKEAKIFNSIANDNLVQGMKTAALMDRQILEAEKEQIKLKERTVREETPIPTGAEIRKAREEGEYR